MPPLILNWKVLVNLEGPQVTRDAEKTFEVYGVLAVLQIGCAPRDSVDSHTLLAGNTRSLKRGQTQEKTSNESEADSKRGISSAAPATQNGRTSKPSERLAGANPGKLRRTSRVIRD